MSKKCCQFYSLGKRIYLSMFFLFFSLFSFAQQEITAGRTVIGESNVPLAGVSVNVEGSTIGTTTDTEGKFTIQTDRGATLVFSFVGYETKQVRVTNANSVNYVQLVLTTSTYE